MAPQDAGRAGFEAETIQVRRRSGQPHCQAAAGNAPSGHRLRGAPAGAGTRQAGSQGCRRCAGGQTRWQAHGRAAGQRRRAGARVCGRRRAPGQQEAQEAGAPHPHSWLGGGVPPQHYRAGAASSLWHDLGWCAPLLTIKDSFSEAVSACAGLRAKACVCMQLPRPDPEAERPRVHVRPSVCQAMRMHAGAVRRQAPAAAPARS